MRALASSSVFPASVSSKTSPRPCLGFSRWDLLTIVAMVSVLLAVVFTMTQHWRNRVRLAQCQDNLAQVSRAVLRYAEDQGRRLPDMTGAPSPGGWWWYKESVKSYAGLTGPSSANDRVFGCPLDRGYGDGPGESHPFRKSARHDFTSYVFNGVNLPGIPHLSGNEISGIRNPARTLLVMEWTAHAPLSWHNSLTGRANTPFYRDAESVVGFVDGHVALTKFYYDGMNAAYTREPIPGYSYQWGAD